MIRSAAPRRRRLNDVLRLVLLVGLLGAVYLLPPDTSLKEVRRAGVLRACVPTSYPPLVTGDPQMPGIDVELLREVASALGVRLVLSPNAAMGQDFNPRNWRVTRSQCQVLAGGVLASPITRSFLETSVPYLETGWLAFGPGAAADLDGRRVGVFTGISGLDRIALSRALRAAGADVSIVRSAAALEEAVASGAVDVGVSEALVARQIAGRHDWSVETPPGVERHPVAFGLWKGDLTLKRSIDRALTQAQRDGTLQTILDAYLNARAAGG